MPAQTAIVCPKCEHSFVPVKVKKPRVQSEYNKFFTAQMKEPEIRALAHKDRMPKIGAMWTERKKLIAAAAKDTLSAMEVEEDELPVGPPLPIKREVTSASVDEPELTLKQRKAAIAKARKKIKSTL